MKLEIVKNDPIEAGQLASVQVTETGAVIETGAGIKIHFDKEEWNQMPMKVITAWAYANAANDKPNYLISGAVDQIAEILDSVTEEE